MPTSRLRLPYIEAAQAQKHVPHNEALDALDAFIQLAVESRSLTSPPGSPAEGDCYIPASGAPGAWSGFDLAVALSSGGAGVWRDGIALTAQGGRVTLRAQEEELTLSGSFVETADAAFIANRAIVLGVAARTTEAITGATSYAVGVRGDATKFGDLLGTSAGATNIGVVGPTAYYADPRG